MVFNTATRCALTKVYITPNIHLALVLPSCAHTNRHSCVSVRSRPSISQISEHLPIRTTFPASNCDPGPSVPLLQELNTLDKVHVYFARPPSILHSGGACLPAQRIGLDSPSNENTFRYRIRGVYLQTRNKADPKAPHPPGF